MSGEWTSRRDAMMNTLRAQGIRDPRVLAAMEKVRRHLFIPEARRGHDAYGDHPCSIGHGQTISQPYIVAYMTELMNVKKGEKVLEIGTGSGYQTAILAELGCQVYSVEIIPELAFHAEKTLAAEGYGPDTVHLLIGDGRIGWPENAPYDVIIAACAPEGVPTALVEQLADSGRMVIPVGSDSQHLVVVRKVSGRITTEDDLPVRFVPMVGAN